MRYRQLPLDQINVTDRNIRKTTSEEGMAELTASIDRFGLLQPIVVFETGEDQYDLVTGHRRFAAVCELGWDSIPAMVTKSEEQAGVLAQAQENLVREDMTLGEELDVISTAMQLTENAQREGLEDIEEAEALLRVAGGRNSHGGDRKSNQVCSANLNQCELADLLGKSTNWVNVRLSLLLDLPDEVRSRVTRKPPTAPENAPGIAVNTAAEIARLKDDPDLQIKLADKVEREGMTKPQTRRAVQKIKEDPDAAEAVLAAKVDDSSFDAVTQRKADKTPAKQAASDAKSTAPEVMMKRFSQAYQNLCIALEPDRIAEVEAAGKNAIAEVRAEVAENACYMRALLDNFIHDWRLDELCNWTQEQAAEVASMGSGPRVTGLELLDEEEAE
jgi:ParB-like chromosome segregation protein Spo0J